MTFDLLPWETLPEAPEHATETIAWNGGELVLPRLGYLTVDELQGIREVDPQNALYRLITAKAVELSQAEDQHTPSWCYGLLTRLMAQDLGASIGRMSPEEAAVQVLHAGIIGPFLEQARAITNRVTIRGVTVILNRIKPGWSDEQTRQLPGPLLTLLHRFEQEEEQAGAGPQQDPAAQMQALEEALGKLREVSSTATDSTGPEPIGGAAGSGPEPLSSPASGSGSSLAPTSSRRSRQGTRPKGIASTGKN